MKQPNFELAKKLVFQRLENELSPKLLYHGIHHTQEDVMPAAERLAIEEGLGEEDILLVKTAALFHDIGHIEKYIDHESASAKIASEMLPSLGYSPEQIRLIVNIIMATKMPQNPRTHLEAIMCDADLDSLGRDDFFITSHSLRLEIKLLGTELNVREWYLRQMKFLESHVYFTDAAQRLRQPTVEKNISELRNILQIPS